MKTNIERTPQGLFSLMRRHPYLLTFLLCVMLVPFGFADRAKITAGSCVYLGIVVGVIAISAIFLFNLGKNLTEKLLLSGVTAAGTAACMLTVGFVENKAVAVSFVALAIILAAAVFLQINRSLSATAMIALIILLGIAIRFVYILYTGWQDRQHDIGYFNWTWGHANYIEYWYNNGLKLPDFDVRSKFQYYQPPLHHMIAGWTLKLYVALGIEYDTACEALQMLPFLYSSLVPIVSYRIFRHVKLSGTPLIVAMTVLSIHPTFILMGGSFNNDMLSALLTIFAVMFALRWYDEPKLKNIIPLAFSIGLGMMAKLAAWMVAPAVALLFLYVFIKNIKDGVRYIGQFAMFGVICVPLGLWWGIRNYLTFQVPLTYIPEPTDISDPQYCGDMSVFERLFNFGDGQLSFVYTAFTQHNCPYDEFNPTVALFKTALFDECQHSINDMNFPQITVTGPILFWIGAVLGVLCFVSLVVSLISKKSGLPGIIRAFFAVMTATMVGSYYYYGFKYPFSCSMNIRFCAALIPICIMGLGLMLKRFSGDKPYEKVIRYSVCTLSAAFAAIVYIVYTQVGMTVF